MTALPIEKIVRRPDGRAIDLSAVAALAESIATVGLINPIRVRAVGDGWEVIAGAHRLEASKSLGLAEIEALVVSDDDLHAELAMIDENLCRAELTPADRAQQTARRKAIYLELHPETAHGANLQGAGVAKLATPETPSFVTTTAALSGQSERAVRRDAERGEKVCDQAIELLRGTSLDTGTYLDKIKNLMPSEQVHAVKRDLAYARQQAREAEQRKASGIARRFKVADEPLNDDDAREKQVAALMSAWNKASAEARQEFLERIDTPVFDRSAA